MRTWTVVSKVLVMANFLFLNQAMAQLEFAYVDDYPVFHDGKQLKYPYAGGINAAQYGTIDLDLDGLEDLVIFDRSSDKINTFINSGSAYEYAPYYEHFFPEGIKNWIIFADYDCDGIKDIFANTNLGIKVYRNISNSNIPSWELIVDPLLTLGTSSQVNLFLNASDIPSIADLDGDGDLDVLVYNFSVGAFIEHHKNFSVERTGACGALDFERVSRNFGGVEECTCNEFAFEGDEGCGTTGRQQHTGGKTILVLDRDGDRDQDLVIGQELCDDLYYLENKGDNEDAFFNDFTDVFPSTSGPVNFITFPAPYFADFDFDGVKDLIVAPNLRSNPGNLIDLQQSSWFYKNNGTNSNFDFELIQRDFLQDEMIDLGDLAYPAFSDFDADGDLDLFVGNLGAQHEDGFYATVTVYRNTGSSLERATTDFAGLSALKYTYIKPAFADMNGDSRLDFVFTGLNADNEFGYFYILNASSGAPQFDLNEILSIPFSGSPADDLLVYDVDADGLLDILIGKSNGRLEFHRNVGSIQSAEYQLENETFLGLDFSSANGNLAIAINDIDADGVDDLITTDRSGVLKVYLSFAGNDVGTPIEAIVLNELIGQKQGTVLERLSKPAVADLFGNDTRVIAIGSVQGGVRLLSSGESTPMPDGLSITAFPSPSGPDKLIRFVSSNANVSLELFEVSGRKIFGPVQMNANVPIQLDLSPYNDGLYFARVRSGSSAKTVKFLVGEGNIQ